MSRLSDILLGNNSNKEMVLPNPVDRTADTDWWGKVAADAIATGAGRSLQTAMHGLQDLDGNPMTGKGLENWGAELANEHQQFYEPGSARYYASAGLQSLPEMGADLGISLAASALGTPVAGAAKTLASGYKWANRIADVYKGARELSGIKGGLARMILPNSPQSAIGALTSTGLEASMEGQRAMDDYIEEAKQNGTYIPGVTEEEGRNLRSRVFRDNAALLALTNAAEFNSIFKNSKGIKGGIGRLGTNMASEGLEEAAQQIIPKAEQGQDWNFTDPDVIEAGLIGAGMGGVMHGAGRAAKAAFPSWLDPDYNPMSAEAQAAKTDSDIPLPTDIDFTEADPSDVMKWLNKQPGFTNAGNVPTNADMPQAQQGQNASLPQGVEVSGENSLDGFDKRFVSKWESQPGATDLAGVQQSVKNAFNAAVAEYGDGVTLTGGAEKGYHAGGAEGHEGGWKIDVDKASVKDPQKFLQAMARHGFKVGDEGDHYDLSGHAKGGVGGTVVATPDSFISDGGQVAQPAANGKREGHANAWAITDVFRRAGYNDEAIAGILGRVQQEHNFDTSDVPEHEEEGMHLGGYGMFQWNGGRTTAFLDWAKQNGKDPQNATTQAEYALYEAKQRGLTPDKMNSLSAEEAADLWTSDWEVGKPGSERKYAGEWRERLKNGGGGVSTNSISAQDFGKILGNHMIDFAGSEDDAIMNNYQQIMDSLGDDAKSVLANKFANMFNADGSFNNTAENRLALAQDAQAAEIIRSMAESATPQIVAPMVGKNGRISKQAVKDYFTPQIAGVNMHFLKDAIKNDKLNDVEKVAVLQAANIQINIPQPQKSDTEQAKYVNDLQKAIDSRDFDKIYSLMPNETAKAVAGVRQSEPTAQPAMAVVTPEQAPAQEQAPSPVEQPQEVPQTQPVEQYNPDTAQNMPQPAQAMPIPQTLPSVPTEQENAQTAAQVANKAQQVANAQPFDFNNRLAELQAMPLGQLEQLGQQTLANMQAAGFPVNEALATDIAAGKENAIALAESRMAEAGANPTVSNQEQVQPQTEVTPQPEPVETAEQDNVASEATSEQEPQGKSIPGKTGKTVTILTDSGKEIQATYKLVPSRNVVTSHDPDSMAVNPEYPQELQPRDRQRASMQEQVAKMAGSLRPADLGASRNLNQGAPIVRKDGVVLNGNGRAMAIIEAQKHNRQSDEAYSQYLIDHAEEFGFEKSDVESLVNSNNKPMLVRMVDEEAAEDIQDIINSTTGGSRMGASEQAKADAKKITIEDLNKFVPNDKGDLTTANNRDFVGSVINRITTDAERNAYLDDNGNVNADGIQRVKRALFAMAYGDDALLSKMAESTDDNTRNITNGLTNAAPEIAKVNKMMEEGTAQQYNIAPTISEAVKRFDYLRESGTPVEGYLDQTNMFSEFEDTEEMKQVLRALDEFKRSGKKVSQFVSRIGELAEMQGNPNQISLMDNMKPLTLQGIIEEAHKDVSQQDASGNLFEQEQSAKNAQTEPVSQRDKLEKLYHYFKDRYDQYLHDKVKNNLEMFVPKPEDTEFLHSLGIKTNPVVSRSEAPKVISDIEKKLNEMAGTSKQEKPAKSAKKTSASKKSEPAKESTKNVNTTQEATPETDNAFGMSADDVFAEFANLAGITPAQQEKAEPESKSTNKKKAKKKRNMGLSDTSKEREEELKKQLSEALKKSRNRLNSTPVIFDPDVIVPAFNLGRLYVQRGAENFAEYARDMIDAVGDSVRGWLRPVWEMIENYPDGKNVDESLVIPAFRYVGSFMHSKPQATYDEVRADFVKRAGEDTAAKFDDLLKLAYSGAYKFYNDNAEVTDNELNDSPRENPARDSAGNNQDEVGAVHGNGEPVSRGGQGVQPTGKDSRAQHSGGVHGRSPSRSGETSDSGVQGSESGRGNRDDSAGGKQLTGSRRDSFDGAAVDDGRNAESFGAFKERPVDGRTSGTKSETVKVNKDSFKAGDKAQIAGSMPFLMPEQVDDVVEADIRLYTNKGEGMMFTNGTGTGKTFTGLGCIKRAVQQGKKNILIIAPTDKVQNDWITTGKGFFGLDISKLENTTDAGDGIVITSYENVGANNKLVKRDWDMIVTDESHKLMQGEKGNRTKALENVRAMTYHADGLRERFERLHAKEYDRLAELRGKASDKENPITAAEKQELDNLQAKLIKESEKAIAEWKTIPQEDKPKVLFLSATPFSYVPDIDYAEGYLFHYDRKKNQNGGYNQPNAYDDFMIKHFGYRMRVGKLTKPDADVNSDLMEVNFNNWLKDQGVLSGRKLQVKPDYERGYILVDGGVGKQIDEGMKIATEWGVSDSDQKYSKLHGLFEDKLKGNKTRYLLEAIKAKEAVDLINQYVKANKKVVVFHDFKKNEAENPFVLTDEDFKYMDEVDRNTARQQYARFCKDHPELLNLNLDDLQSPIERFTEEFGDSLRIFNGDIPKKKRENAVREFQDDSSKVNIILCQRASAKEGISMHDTTGKHQRVLIDLGLATRPTDLIQGEGRIYRTGVITDAIIRYLNTGTDMEKRAFASTIAGRASTAENLSMGEDARALRNAIVEGFMESIDGDSWKKYLPNSKTEGKGGKERDAKLMDGVSPYEAAKSDYFANQKKNSRNKAQEGIDYFPTPEPIGFKMVEWLGLKPGDRALEPSAGHGAISRYFGAETRNTIVEPSPELATLAKMRLNGGETAKVVEGRFEDLDIHNKYEGIAMNPPYGVGGKTAYEHVAKAFDHLADGGRLIAIVPDGPAANKRLENWLYGDGTKANPGKPNAALLSEIKLPQVTFNRAGTSVATKILIIDKYNDPADLAEMERRQIEEGIDNLDLTGINDINELFDKLEYVRTPERVGADIPRHFTNSTNKKGNAQYKYITLPDDVKLLDNRKVWELANFNNGYRNINGGWFEFRTENDRAKFVKAANKYLAGQEVLAAEQQEIVDEVLNNQPEGNTEHFEGGSFKDIDSSSKPQARIKGNMPRNVYDPVKSLAQRHGGQYKKGARGFVFDSEEDRNAFLKEAEAYLGEVDFSATGKAENMKREITFTPDNKLTEREKELQRMGERMGVPIVFFEGNKDLNGFHSNGISFINRRAGMSPSWTFWHEAFHWMSRKSPALFKSLMEHLKSKAPFSKEQLNAYRASIGEPNMSDKKVIEEMMADAMPKISKRMPFLKELAAENKSLYQRFVAWIREAMDTLRDFFHSNPTGLSTEQVDLMHEKFADLVRDIHGLHNEVIIKVANTPDRTFTLPSGEPLINYSRNVEKSLDNSDNLRDNVGEEAGQQRLADKYSPEATQAIQSRLKGIASRAKASFKVDDTPAVKREKILHDFVDRRDKALAQYTNNKTGKIYDELVDWQMLLDYSRELIANDADGMVGLGIQSDRGQESGGMRGLHDETVSGLQQGNIIGVNQEELENTDAGRINWKVPHEYDTHDNDKLIKFIRNNGYAKHSDNQGALPIWATERVRGGIAAIGKYQGRYVANVDTTRLSDNDLNNLRTLAKNNDVGDIVQNFQRKETLSYVFGNSQQGEIFKNAAIAYLNKEASLSAKGSADSLDVKYFSAIRDMESAKTDAEREAARQELVKMVEQKAKDAGFENAIPEQTVAYKTRTKAAPKKSIKVYKVFTVSNDGSPTALFIGGTEKLPQGVWLDAQDAYHFKATNGKYYVPSTQNPYTKGGKTGASVEIPNDKVRQELIERGFLKKGSTATKITALAYRPGWHAGTMPFFPQGGMKPPKGMNSAYPNIHRYNQVVFECELAADKDYTQEAENQPKARKKDGSLDTRNADLQYMPENGYYYYATNPLTHGHPELGMWAISGSLKINRALSQEECDKILADNNMAPQEWEQGEMKLEDLGYTGQQYDAARKTLAPITYDDNGNIIPLSQRFDAEKDDVRYSVGPVNPPGAIERIKDATRKLLGLQEKLEDNVQDRHTEKQNQKTSLDDTLPLTAMAHSMKYLAGKNEAIKRMYYLGKRCMDEQEHLRNEFKEVIRKINTLMTDEADRDSLHALLWAGDADGKEYTTEELQREGFSDNVIAAYKMVRDNLAKAYNLVNDARMQVKVRNRTIKASELPEFMKENFLDSGDIINTQDVGNGKIVVTYRGAKVYENRSDIVNDDMLKAMEADDNIVITNKEELGKGVYNITYNEKPQPMGKLTGYMPHFFHRFMVYAKTKDEDGNDMRVAIGSAESLADATKIANEVAKHNPDKQFVIDTHSFEYGDENNGVVVGDLNYQEMTKRLAENTEMSLTEANKFLHDSAGATLKSRHRFFGNMMKRTGVQGFDENMMWALTHYFNSASRYVAMEHFKPDAISWYERFFGDFNADPKTIKGQNKRKTAQIIRDYINDVNGTPREIEKWCNEVVDRIPIIGEKLNDTYNGRPALALSSKVSWFNAVTKLGCLSISSPMLNFMQFINVATMLDSVKYAKMGLNKALKPSELDNLILDRSGIMDEINLASDAGGYTQTRDYGGVHKGLGKGKELLDKSMFFFTWCDALMRKAAVLGAYYQGVQEKGMKPDKGQTISAEALEYAREVNSEANFDYSAANTPEAIRMGSVITQQAFQFQKYPIMQFEFFWNHVVHGTNSQRAKFLMPYFLLTGLPGMIPFGELLASMLGLLIPGDDDDFAKKMKAELMRWAGNDSAKQAVVNSLTNGPLAAFTGIDISERAGMQNFFAGRYYGSKPESTPGAIGTLLGGAAYSTVSGVQNQLRNGNPIEAIKAISPGLGNWLQAAVGETRTTHHRVGSTYDGMYERILHGMGFRHIDETNTQFINSYLYESKKRQQEDKKFIMDAYLDDPSEENKEQLMFWGISDKQLKQYKEGREKSSRDRAAGDDEMKKKSKKPKTEAQVKDDELREFMK